LAFDANRKVIPLVTRFAPSPTGRLHLGHAYSALFAWHRAMTSGGIFRLRIEDIDSARCRAEFTTGIYADLEWLGLSWPKPVRVQSEHLEEYRMALARLDELGILYPCFCSRKDIAASLAAPHEAGERPYPGTCRDLKPEEAARRKKEGRPFSLRLDLAKALDLTGPLSFTDEKRGCLRVEPEPLGDVILARRDSPSSYHLCVSLDDHLEGVSLVTRGEDLLPATHIHRLLQALLGLDEPRYAHHVLIRDADGQRLSKRDRAASLASLREAGKSPAELRALAGFPD
jgi:glutamyl-Q tRNA(Asp) synthetase